MVRYDGGSTSSRAVRREPGQRLVYARPSAADDESSGWATDSYGPAFGRARVERDGEEGSANPVC